MGLVYKDLLCLRKSVVSYLVTIGIYGALALTGAWDVNLLAAIVAMMVGMLPFSVFSYDYAAKRDCYGLALPVGRTKTVAARYVTVLVLAAAGMAVSLLLGVLATVLGQLAADGWMVYILTAASAMGLGMLVNALLLPLLYKFGAERARIVLFAALGTAVLAWVLALRLLGGMEWLRYLDAPSPALTAAVPFIIGGGGLAVLALSFLASRHIYGKREM